MLRYLSKSILLLFFAVAICCCIYPLVLWAIAQMFFPFEAGGSMISGPDGKIVGSRLIAQAFTKDEYFQPRPSACSYDASASSSSSLAASNYVLRERVAQTLGPIVKYKDGKLVGPDVESWFKEQTDLPSKWATLHSADSADIQAKAFLLWREAHPDVELQNVPADFVTTSASGLDPHITLQSAEFQLDRIAATWAEKLKSDPALVRKKIQGLLLSQSSSPLGGLAGEPFINVLEINLRMVKELQE